MLRVKYMNMGVSRDRCYEFLEWCRSERVGITFTVVAAAYKGEGTMMIAGYRIVSR